MKVLVTEHAEKELSKMDSSLGNFFLKHIEKISLTPGRRRLKFGLPFNVENVSKQARLVYELEGETLYVLHCFATHKEYEKWFKSFK